mgnify:CR=1 FL=1
MTAFSATERVVVALGALLAIACQLSASSALAQESGRARLKAAKSWGYLLQNVNAARLARTDYDVLVVDAGAPAPGAQLSKADLKRLKRKTDGSRRIVLAYVNIGEAEDYRHYWKTAWAKLPPAWLGSANCRWKGDHRVRHWHTDWHAIVTGGPQSLIGRIVDAGFDGAWLDRVDIYYWSRLERWQAGAEMVDLVVALSQFAKARNPDFLIVPQNGEELLSDPRYLAAIDGQGKEDMLYGDRGNDVLNQGERIARAERNIQPAIANGLPVLAVEYVRDKGKVADIARRLSGLGYIPYFGPRSLSSFGFDGPPHPEDRDSEPTLADTGAEGIDGASACR